MQRHAGGRSEDPRKIRLFALAGVVVSAVALPLAVASAGPAGPAGAESPAALRSAPHDDPKAPSAASGRSPLLLGLGLATAVRCGPRLSSPDGVEAQTCVLTQGADTWARTYYRNATGGDLDAVLSLMGPGARTVQMHCAVSAEDEPGQCETPRLRTEGDLAGYTAVTEFAGAGRSGPLLLRSGSNSSSATAS